jgi:hypothetical protein
MDDCNVTQCPQLPQIQEHYDAPKEYFQEKGFIEATITAIVLGDHAVFKGCRAMSRGGFGRHSGVFNSAVL